jgi:DNA-binding MarR family transcriptional regulator
MTMSGSKVDLSGLKAVSDVDKIIHEPGRLHIMALLYVVEKADFTFVMGQTGLTRGNLSSHLSKLEAAGYVDIEKTFKGKRPLTLLRLTGNGRSAFQVYIRNMKQALEKLTG